MRRSLLLKLLALLIVVVAGIAIYQLRSRADKADEKLAVTWQALRETSPWTLYSIDPSYREPRSPGAKRLQGYEILGEIPVTSEDVRSRVIQDLRCAVAASDGPPMMCFNPRHAIQLRRDGQVIDVLICFECNALHTYIDNVMTESTALQGSPECLSGILRAAGISIAP